MGVLPLARFRRRAPVSLQPSCCRGYSWRPGEAWLLVLTAGGDEVVRAEPFDAIELTLTGLWIRPA